MENQNEMLEDQKDLKSMAKGIWIETKWNDQGLVYRLGERVYYLEIVQSEIIQKSMLISEWQKISEEYKNGEGEEFNGAARKTRRFENRVFNNRKSRKFNKRSFGERAVARRRSYKVFKDK